jgi:uncharacterized protein (DUF1810 family)
VEDAFNLGRFVGAQQPVISQVYQELRDGRKQTHWMWFIFPQLAGLGRSAMAQKYAICSVAEARAYLNHSVLGVRLIDMTEIVNRIDRRSVRQIFGAPDDMKFHSSMTLFARARPEIPVFGDALGKYFEGDLDGLTVGGLERLSHTNGFGD